MAFRFEGLYVYQAAVKLSSNVFDITKGWPTTYRYSLGDQLNRAALSISLNIAEGTSRKQKDFQHFLSIARGSCYECVPIIMIASEKHLISEAERARLYSLLEEIAKMLTTLREKVAPPTDK